MDQTNDNNSRKVATVTVDKKACIGAATCVVLAPNAFELDSDNIASLKTTALTHTDQELINAAASCPTQAIKLFDASGIEIKI